MSGLSCDVNAQLSPQRHFGHWTATIIGELPPPHDDEAESQAHSHRETKHTRHTRRLRAEAALRSGKSQIGSLRPEAVLLIILSSYYHTCTWAFEMKNRNRAHFTVVYIFLSLLNAHIVQTNGIYNMRNSCWCSQSEKNKIKITPLSYYQWLLINKELSQQWRSSYARPLLL